MNISEEQIIEGNKLIAQFEFNEKDWDYLNSKYAVFEKELKYHSSWNSLMPVLEMIENIKTENYYNFEKVSTKDFIVGICIEEENHVIITVHFKQPDPTKQRQHKQFACKGKILGYSKIEATWLTIIDFIKWYNTNNIL